MNLRKSALIRCFKPLKSLRLCGEKNMKILLVEDEAGLILTLTDRLQSEGFDVKSAADGEVGLNLALSENFDLIILDVMLPKKNGYDVCRDLRQKQINTPVLMLTAKGETIDKVLGLKLGADDYLTKPFEVIELLARIEALLRRSPQTVKNSADAFRFGDVEIDFKRAEFLRKNQPIELSARLSRHFTAEIGATIRLYVDAMPMHLFDPESGKVHARTPLAAVPPLTLVG